MTDQEVNASMDAAIAKLADRRIIYVDMVDYTAKVELGRAIIERATK